MVAPTKSDMIEEQMEEAAEEAPPIPTMADIAPDGYTPEPEEEAMPVDADFVASDGL